MVVNGLESSTIIADFSILNVCGSLGYFSVVENSSCKN